MFCIKTPALRSYDTTIMLPTEIHLATGAIPRATAVYDGSPDVEYESLGELCEAHHLDPEVGLDEVRSAELKARVS